MTNKTIFQNQAEEYGGPEYVTVEDYQELNPNGTFVEDGDFIYEIFSDAPGDLEPVAVSINMLETQAERDELLRKYWTYQNAS